MSFEPSWSEDQIRVLREMWLVTKIVQTLDGPILEPKYSTREIGKTLGVSKNAVVSKARRTRGLESRPSPIIRGGLKRVAGPKRNAPPPRVTLPPLTQTVIAPVTVSRPRPPHPPHPDIIPSTPAPSSNAVPFDLFFNSPQPDTPMDYLPSRPQPRVRACRWPIGEPGTKAFRFCDDTANNGKPYCSEHCKLAYVPKQPRDRREDAAA